MKIAYEYINLLPRAEKKPGRKIGPAPVIAALFVLGWAAAFGWQIKLGLEQKDRLSSLDLRRQALLQELAAAHKELGLEVPRGTSPEKAALIHNLLGERVLWSEVFKHFSRIVPKGLWFDNLEGTAAGRPEIRIKGGAFNYLSIAEFMQAMEKSGFFEKPQLLYAQKAAVQGHDIVGFEIVCGVKTQGAR